MLQRVRGLLLLLTVWIHSSGLHAQAQPTRVVTLAEVLKRARANPPAVLAALATLERVRAEEAYARGAYIPHLTAEVASGVAYDNRETTPNEIRVPDDIPPEQRDAYTRSARTPRYRATSVSSYGRLTFDYALIDSARRHAIKSAASLSEAERRALSEVQRSALAGAAELYLSSLAASELVSDARLTQTRREEQHQAISGLVKAGFRPPIDAIRSEIEAIAARYALETREVEEQAAFAALAVAIGVDPTEPVRPAPLDDSAWPAPLEPLPASVLAIERRPDLRQLEAQLASRRADQRAAIGARLPTVGALGSGNVSHAQILTGTGIQGFSYESSGFLYLRWAALDPAVWRRVAVAGAAVDEAQRSLESALLAVRAEVVEAAYQVKRTRALLEQASQILTGARAARGAQNQRYRAGIASLLDLLDAEGLEQNARRQRIEAERDHRIARVRLLAVCGVIEQLGL